MQLPSSQSNQTCVLVTMIDGGTFTLPQKHFISPTSEDALVIVPSMFFLIEHISEQTSQGSGIETVYTTKPKHRLLFDLGLRTNPCDYTAAQRSHLQNRIPLHFPKPIESRLADHELQPSDIDLVILSHVHWDHTGDSFVFSDSSFLVGHGSLDLLDQDVHRAMSHAHFDKELLPRDRTFELPPVSQSQEFKIPSLSVNTKWTYYDSSPFPAMIDLYNDGSVYVVDAPGHLQGHINLLCRTGPDRFMLLAGDSAHDMQLLTGDKSIATWQDYFGHTCCIHVDKEQARLHMKRLQSLKSLEKQHVEVVLAHDHEWYSQEVSLSVAVGR